MKKPLLMFICAAAVAASACNKTEKTESDTAVVTENTTGTTTDTETLYREQASRVTERVATDLELQEDTETREKVQEAYYNRAQRAEQVRRRHAADTSGMYAELREINLDTDKEFEKILTPDRFKLYQPRSTTYYTEFDEVITSSLNINGMQLSPDAEIKTKTDKDGDTKTKITDGDREIKIKRDADGETKTKIEDPSGETTIKTDPDGESKTKVTRKNQ